MKILIAEDDFTSRLLLQELLKVYGACHVVVNGKEAVMANQLALDADDPYDLICLDIMMPEMDGRAALDELRRQEEAVGVLPSGASKIVMTTALSDANNVIGSFREQCDAYLVKPLEKAKLLETLRSLSLIPEQSVTGSV